MKPLILQNSEGLIPTLSWLSDRGYDGELYRAVINAVPLYSSPEDAIADNPCSYLIDPRDAYAVLDAERNDPHAFMACLNWESETGINIFNFLTYIRKECV